MAVVAPKTLSQSTQRTSSAPRLGADLVHRRRFVSRLIDNETGINGNSWVVTSIPHLSYSPITYDGFPESVTFIGGDAEFVHFEFARRGYRALFGEKYELRPLGDEWIISRAGVKEWAFFGPTMEIGWRGQIKRWEHHCGDLTLATHFPDGRLRSLDQTRRGGPHRVSLCYSYFETDPSSKMLAGVEKRQAGAFGVEPIWRIEFSYHGGENEFGLKNDLATVSAQDYQLRRRNWSQPKTTHYRYYIRSRPPGFLHGLKYEFDPAATEEILAGGLSPIISSEEEISPFASSYFEYDSQRRVTLASFEKGARTFRYSHVASDGSSRRNWARKTLMRFPDESLVITYFNRQNLPVARLSGPPDDQTLESWSHDAQGRLIRHLLGADIQSIQEPQTPRDNLIVRARRKEAKG